MKDDVDRALAQAAADSADAVREEAAKWLLTIKTVEVEEGTHSCGCVMMMMEATLVVFILG